MKYLKGFNEFDINENKIDESLLGDAYNKVMDYFNNNYFKRLFNRIGISAKTAYDIFIDTGKNSSKSEYEQWVENIIYICTNTKAGRYVSLIYNGKTYGYFDDKIPNNVKKEYGIKEAINLKAQDDQMQDIDPYELTNVLYSHKRLKTAPFIWGAPGIGKTQIIVQFAKEAYGSKEAIIILNIGLMAPEDFVGLPTAEKTGGKYVFSDGTTVDEKLSFFATPFFLPRNVKDNVGGVLFLDEYNRADSKVLDASNSLILDGKMGTYTLPPKWFIVAAGNRPEGYDMIPGIKKLGADQGSRFSHYNLVPTVDALIAHYKTDSATMASVKNIEETVEELKTYINNPKYDYTTADLDRFLGSSQLDIEVESFLKFKEEALHTLGDTTSAQLFASPRGWIQSSIRYRIEKEIAKAQGKELSNKDKLIIFNSTIGKNITTLFMNAEMTQYITERDIAYILDGKLELTTEIPDNKVYSSGNNIIEDNALSLQRILLTRLIGMKKLDSGGWANDWNKVVYVMRYVKERIYKIDGLDESKGYLRKGNVVTGFGAKIISFGTDLVKEFTKLKTKYNVEQPDGSKIIYSFENDLIARLADVTKYEIPKDPITGIPVGVYL